MIQKEVMISNHLGLHARPAIQFVQKANEFHCDITLIKGNKTANAKSISQVLALKARQYDQIALRANGEGECHALNALLELLSSTPTFREVGQEGE